MIFWVASMVMAGLRAGRRRIRPTPAYPARAALWCARGAWCSVTPVAHATGVQASLGRSDGDRVRQAPHVRGEDVHLARAELRLPGGHDALPFDQRRASAALRDRLGDRLLRAA